ncbi:MAG: hypothetical protein C4582_00625 [Desulfobacteraceae bacterium]|nr:MAG: hypothetical protein C4582_00625 [Desulfobacteraceae bacterium]
MSLPRNCHSQKKATKSKGRFQKSSTTRQTSGKTGPSKGKVSSKHHFYKLSFPVNLDSNAFRESIRAYHPPTLTFAGEN